MAITFPSDDFFMNLGFSSGIFGIILLLGRLFAGYKDLTTPSIILIVIGAGLVYIRSREE